MFDRPAGLLAGEETGYRPGRNETSTAARRARSPYTRSGEANRRLLGAAARHAEEGSSRGGQAFSADSWHVWAKSKWLGCTDHILPSGKTLVIPNQHGGGLDVAEFSDYMTKSRRGQ